MKVNVRQCISSVKLVAFMLSMLIAIAGFSISRINALETKVIEYEGSNISGKVLDELDNFDSIFIVAYSKESATENLVFQIRKYTDGDKEGDLSYISLSADEANIHSPQETKNNDINSNRYLSGAIPLSRIEKVELLKADARLDKVELHLLNVAKPEYETKFASSTYNLGSVEIISRSGWGCPDNDPASPYYCDGPFWSTWYYPTTHIVVHHTATGNNDEDWAAHVRRIWYSHSHLRDADPNDGVQGWTDIGYNYLIDPNGKIYEGRYGGLFVSGGHVRGHNSGSVGIGMLGTYIDGDITSAARNSLRSLTQEIINYNHLNPKQGMTNINGRYNQVISGHRDWAATQCPGEFFYATLPALRNSLEPSEPPSDGSPHPIYRAWSRNNSAHIYAAGYEQFARVLSAHDSGWWRPEGIEFRAYLTKQPGTVPVYRLYNSQTRTHHLALTTARTWSFDPGRAPWRNEGVLFYAYDEPGSGRVAIHHFENPLTKANFYTSSEAEANKVQTEHSTTWKYHGIAFYALQ
jgi:hypothetical protein